MSKPYALGIDIGGGGVRCLLVNTQDHATVSASRNWSFPAAEGSFGLGFNLDLDAMWQLIGFFLGWKGGPGRGRALGCGEVKFTGQVLPNCKKVTYRIDMKRVIMRKLVMGIADARLEVDGREIYVANDLRVGLFTQTDSF